MRTIKIFFMLSLAACNKSSAGEPPPLGEPIGVAFRDRTEHAFLAAVAVTQGHTLEPAVAPLADALTHAASECDLARALETGSMLRLDARLQQGALHVTASEEPLARCFAGALSGRALTGASPGEYAVQLHIGRPDPGGEP